MTFSAREKRLFIILSLSSVVAWILFHGDIYWRPGTLLPRDNASANYSFFLYIVEHLRFLKRLPDWVFTKDGGVWVEPLANNYLFLLPNKWVGLFLARFTAFPANTIYKLSFLWLGQGIFLLGVFVVARKICRSVCWAILATLLCFFSGICVGLLHQEEAFATLFYIPWIWICLLKVSENPRYLVLASALIGLSFNNHYPHLIVLYLFIILLCALLFSRQLRGELLGWYHVVRSGPHLVPISLIAFLLSASPVFYSYLRFKDLLGAPDRLAGTSVLHPSYAAYADLSRRDFTSVHPLSLLHYLGIKGLSLPVMGPLDENALFVVFGFPILLIVAMFSRRPLNRFLLSSSLLLGVACLGVFTPVPELLWRALPGIQLFRQWYHFVPLLNLHLLFLSLFALHEIARWSRTVFTCALFIMVSGGAIWSHAATQKIRAMLVQQHPYFESRSTEGYLDSLVVTGNKLLGHVVAKTKTAAHAEIKRYSITGNLFWHRPDGSLMKASREEISTQATSRGFRFERKDPANQLPLILLQHWDGNWRSREKTSGWEPSKKGVWGTVELPTAASVELERIHSPWHMLILLMWLPAICVGVSLFPSLKRSAHRTAAFQDWKETTA